jgi:hypothetical protein
MVLSGLGSNTLFQEIDKSRNCHVSQESEASSSRSSRSSSTASETEDDGRECVDAILVFNQTLDEDEGPNSIMIFRTDTLTWSQLPPLDTKIDRFAIASSGEDIFVVGGISGGKCLNTVRVLNLHTWKWSLLPSRMHQARANSAAVVRQLSQDLQQLIVIGGQTGIDDESITSVEVCNFPTSTWSMLPEVPNYRIGCRAVVSRDELVVWGGTNNSNLHSSRGKIFSFKANVWSAFPTPAIIPRVKFGMTLAKNRVFIVGGESVYGQPQRPAKSCDLSTFECSLLPPIPRMSAYSGPCNAGYSGPCGATICSDKLYVCFRLQSYVFDLESEEWTELPSHGNSVSNPNCFPVRLWSKGFAREIGSF